MVVFIGRHNSYDGDYSEYEADKIRRMGNTQPTRVHYRKLM